MASLFFLRHGTRADHASPGDPPLLPDYLNYDPLVAESARAQMEAAAAHICARPPPADAKHTVAVHFSPYLRCCQSADLIALAVARLQPQAKIQLLCDFGLSEWIHDKMTNPPPFSDLTEAYKMYVPNVRQLHNKRMCLNFRPTTQLGPWNEAGLLYSQYLARSKRYLERLLATYAEQQHVTVVVVGHGYGIANFMLFFLGRPIFEEIPEGGVNEAHRDDKGNWTLTSDCLGILERDPGAQAQLNLEEDIVYYKTNFVKRDEVDDNKQFPAIGFGGLKPRQSFRAPPADSTAQDNLANGGHAPGANGGNPLCPGATTWTPQSVNAYDIKNEFRMKVINDEAFKRAFDITNQPSHPVTPEVSPRLAPSRINSTIDLAKLNSNEEIFHPLRLRYALALDIPVNYLNNKAHSASNSNSAVNLRANSSANSRVNLLGGPTSNSKVNLVNLAGLVSTGSLSPEDGDSANINDVISSLARVRSLQRRRAHLPFNTIDEHKPLLPPPRRPVATGTGTRPRRASSTLRFIPTIESSNVFNLQSASDSEDSDSGAERPEFTWFGKNI